MITETEENVSDIPERLFDGNKQTSYKRLRFFGRGGFGKCYEILNIQTMDVFAGKIISKKLIQKHNQKEKMVQEISIHKSLNHANIVKFFSFFEDSQNIYLVLELCKNRSMMELHMRRKTITEYECRYFLNQIIQGVMYLHSKRIIHRDLKLENLFLNDKLHVKIGDFGLATRLEYDGERKQTVCGTPNYVAPEILTKNGHSFEVDIWSIGCIIYTLLVGHPPFETKSIQETYDKIKKCDYRIPLYMRRPVTDLLKAMLQTNPDLRPKIGELLKFEFLANSAVVSYLPITCLTMAPRVFANEILNTSTEVASQRKPLSNCNGLNNNSFLETTFLKFHLHDTITVCSKHGQCAENYRADIESLHLQLTNLLNTKFKILSSNLSDDYTDPAAQPLYWISKWVDYSDKYGFGYQLCDGVIGVLFNDSTKIVLLPNSK